MKVLSILLLTLALASAARSGPYLPSGWKPDGPAFLLPGEDKKPSENPLKETLLVESEVGSEAEGSDFLREYGPPKLTAKQVTVQDLPEEVTETAFSNLRTNLVEDKPADEAPANLEDAPAKDEVKPEVDEVKPENEEVKTENEEVKAESDETKPESDEVKPELEEEKSANIEEPASDVVKPESVDGTEGESASKSEELVSKSGEIEPETTEGKPEDANASTEGKATDAVTEAKTDAVTEAKTDVTEAVEAISSTTEAVAPVEVEEKSANIELENEADNSDISNVESKFGNDVAADLEKLENEIKDAQVSSTEADPETKSDDTADAKSADVPEGFLEYGPPGFKEYGPPKEDVKSEESPAETEAVESNEARRRRFSPKFSKANKLQKGH